MRISRLIVTLLLLVAYSNALAQGKYAHFRKWEGLYPTYNKMPQKLFDLPEARRPLRKLLTPRIYYLLAKGHTKEVPITIIDHYLKVTVCGSLDTYGCTNTTTLIIDLNDDTMYVAFRHHSQEAKYFAAKGKFTDLPNTVRDSL